MFFVDFGVLFEGGGSPRGPLGTPRVPGDDFRWILDGFWVALGSLWGTIGLPVRPRGAPGAPLNGKKSLKNEVRVAAAFQG